MSNIEIIVTTGDLRKTLIAHLQPGQLQELEPHLEAIEDLISKSESNNEDYAAAKNDGKDEPLYHFQKTREILLHHTLPKVCCNAPQATGHWTDGL